MHKHILQYGRDAIFFHLFLDELEHVDVRRHRR